MSEVKRVSSGACLPLHPSRGLLSSKWFYKAEGFLTKCLQNVLRISKYTLLFGH